MRLNRRTVDRIALVGFVVWAVSLVVVGADWFVHPSDVPTHGVPLK